MNRFRTKSAVLLITTFLSAPAWASLQQSASVTDSDSKTPIATTASATQVGGRVFSFPVASKSVQAQKLVELALDQYENVLLEDSVANARKATEQDPDFALAYAVWSFAARRNQPSPQAAQRAELLAASAPPEERQLVRFLTAVQKDDMLPAITAMNDLLARFPKDRHALYLTAEWLYFQQDYDRSVRLMEQIVKLDPNFAPAFNMLGYARVETGEPDPVKALAYLKRYAELEPGQPNPEDSIGEVSRYVGDDQGSLAHYSAALKLVPTFITSQIGLGDTYVLMGKFAKADAEYQKASAIATNNRDRLHVQYQQALSLFWQGKKAEGLEKLSELEQKAHALREPYAAFEVQEAHALLLPTPKEQLEKLREVEKAYVAPVDGMSESDRNPSLAAIWRDEARVLAQQNQPDAALPIVEKLQNLAAKSRDLIVENCYESARGFVFYAQKDYSSAGDELSADPHSPLAIKWLVAARRKSAGPKSAESAELRLKFQRAPTAEWYLASHSGGFAANSVYP
jgi:tetratricopeptide (TPR) repeat protein